MAQRKIIQVAVCTVVKPNEKGEGAAIFALADDGSLWFNTLSDSHRLSTKWEPVPPLPRPLPPDPARPVESQTTVLPPAQPFPPLR